MRELIYTLLELVRESKKTCDFCSNPYGKDNESAFRIVTRIKSNNEWLADDVVYEDCKEKFTKCERCGRLQTKLDIDFSSGKYICDCIRYNEDLEEKELPSVPYESQSTFYERQINKLQEEKPLLKSPLKKKEKPTRILWEFQRSEAKDKKRNYWKKIKN